MPGLDRDGDFNFPILMFGVTALACWAAFDPRTSASGASTAAIAVGVVYLVGGIFVLREQHREDLLRRWLFTHANEIWQSGVERDGFVVRPDTQLVTYPLGVSMLVLWFQRSGCPRFAEAADANAGKLGALFTTALCGWWSIFGVLGTPLQLLTCVRGGNRSTVHDYMQHLHDIGVTSRWRQHGETH